MPYIKNFPNFALYSKRNTLNWFINLNYCDTEDYNLIEIHENT